MKNPVVILLLCLFLWCCDAVLENDLNSLNGYWEIDYVLRPNGSQKQYNFNLNIDYFEHDGITGFRKKVQPKLDGTFSSSKAIETFEILKKKDHINVVYKTPYATWTETIVTINKEQLVTKNEAGNLYYYKPYQKINP